MSTDFEQLSASLLKAVRDQQSQLQACDQRLSAKREIERELDERIAAKEQEFARWRGKVDGITERCQAMIDHAYQTANTAHERAGKIVGDIGRIYDKLPRARAAK
jgi:uncharacterized protein (DUF3084 family)